RPRSRRSPSWFLGAPLCPRLSAWAEFDLEDLRPQLTGHEEPIAGGVVGDAVENIRLRGLARRQQATKVDVGLDGAGRRIDPRDEVGLPYVGEHLALHELELVEVLEGRAGRRDLDAPPLGERRRIEEPEVFGAVAHDQR